MWNYLTAVDDDAADIGFCCAGVGFRAARYGIGDVEDVAWSSPVKSTSYRFKVEDDLVTGLSDDDDDWLPESSVTSIVCDVFRGATSSRSRLTGFFRSGRFSATIICLFLISNEGKQKSKTYMKCIH
jgi:hypothetical protein